MSALGEAWAQVVRTPLPGITLTVAVYALAVRLHRRAGATPLLTPVLVTIAVVAAVLSLTGISYTDYLRGGQLLSFLLGPATVALAVPLYRAAGAIRAVLLPVVTGVVVGSVTAMASAVLTVRLLGGTAELEATLAPKSATTPIAIALSEAAGGLPALTAVLTVLTGVLGAVAGPWLLDRLGVTEPEVRGLAMGVSAHGIGTSRALQTGALTGAFAALAMALSGVSTSLLLPVVLAVLR